MPLWGWLLWLWGQVFDTALLWIRWSAQPRHRWTSADVRCGLPYCQSRSHDNRSFYFHHSICLEDSGRPIQKACPRRRLQPWPWIRRTLKTSFWYPRKTGPGLFWRRIVVIVWGTKYKGWYFEDLAVYFWSWVLAPSSWAGAKHHCKENC